MAETTKDFQIGNKAKDLLIYTFTVTKPSSEKSLESKDVLSTMLKLKTMKPEEVQAFCSDAAERLRRSSGKQGFPKSTIHTYIRLLRETVVNIVVSIQMANDCRFEVEYDKRLAFIDEALKGCNLMLQLRLIILRQKYHDHAVNDDTAAYEKYHHADKGFCLNALTNSLFQFYIPSL